MTAELAAACVAAARQRRHAVHGAIRGVVYGVGGGMGWKGEGGEGGSCAVWRQDKGGGGGTRRRYFGFGSCWMS